MFLRSNAISNNNDDEKMNPNGVIEEAAEKKDEPCKEKWGKKEYLKTVRKKEASKKTVRNRKKEDSSHSRSFGEGCSQKRCSEVFS